MDFEQTLKRMAEPIRRFENTASQFASQKAFWFMEEAASACDSEIEKVFYVAWRLRLFEDECFGGRSTTIVMPRDSGGEREFEIAAGIVQVDSVRTQCRIGDYRADFVLRRAVAGIDGPFEYGPRVVVECDGHDFHERTKEQAARDKERDRILQGQGYYVLRFTGSELWRDPAACAEQVHTFMEDHLGRMYLRRRPAAKTAPASEETARTH
jgi:very-short-patch-repair endonuclease